MWLCRNAFFGPLGAFDQGLCKNTMRYNIIFAQNQLPTFGCYTIAWSLAVQMQFWFIFPLALLLLQPQTKGFRCGTKHKRSIPYAFVRNKQLAVRRLHLVV